MPANDAVESKAENTEIQSNRSMIDIPDVETELLIPRNRVASVHLRPYNWNNSSWIVFALPYMEQQPLYSAINFNYMWGPVKLGSWSNNYLGNQNLTVRVTIINGLLCPSDPSPALDTTNADEISGQSAAGTSYVGNVGDNCLACNPAAGVLALCASQGYVCRGSQLGDPTVNTPGVPGTPTGSGIFWRECSGVSLAQITDGTSNTFLAGEQLMQVTNWNSWVEANQSIGSTALPLNYVAPGVRIGGTFGSTVISNGTSDTGSWHHWYTFRSQHPGGGNFALCDGSVKFIKNTINFQVYQALSTRNLGEVISADSL